MKRKKLPDKKKRLAEIEEMEKNNLFFNEDVDDNNVSKDAETRYKQNLRLGERNLRQYYTSSDENEEPKQKTKMQMGKRKSPKKSRKRKSPKRKKIRKGPKKSKGSKRKRRSRK